MIFIFVWHAKKLLILSKLNHEMDDIVSIICTSFQLMDIAEVGIIRETRRTIHSCLFLDVATPHVEALESGIQKTLYFCVVFLFEVPRRVKIHGMGDSRVQNDKDGVPLATQNKCTSN